MYRESIPVARGRSSAVSSGARGSSGWNLTLGAFPAACIDSFAGTGEALQGSRSAGFTSGQNRRSSEPSISTCSMGMSACKILRQTQGTSLRSPPGPRGEPVLRATVANLIATGPYRLARAGLTCLRGRRLRSISRAVWSRRHVATVRPGRFRIVQDERLRRCARSGVSGKPTVSCRMRFRECGRAVPAVSRKSCVLSASRDCNRPPVNPALSRKTLVEVGERLSSSLRPRLAPAVRCVFRRRHGKGTAAGAGLFGGPDETDWRVPFRSRSAGTTRAGRMAPAVRRRAEWANAGSRPIRELVVRDGSLAALAGRSRHAPFGARSLLQPHDSARDPGQEFAQNIPKWDRMSVNSRVRPCNRSQDG